MKQTLLYNRIFLAVTFFALFGMATSLYAEGKKPDVSKVDTILRHAYASVKSDDNPSAVNNFKEAGKLAKEINDWQGVVDAAYGLAALGSHKSAHRLFLDATRIASNTNSWEGLVATGYGISSLPQELNAIGSARRAFNMAEDLALQSQDWRGLVETARGYTTLNTPGRGEALLDRALRLVENEKDAEGAFAIAQVYNSMGNKTKAAQAQSLANALNRSQGGDTRLVKPPPPGWSALGKSVRDPDEVPLEVQRLNRASADQDIAHKAEYINEQNRLELEEKRQQAELAQAYLYYSSYYGYPGSNFGINGFGLFGFGLHSLSRSNLHDWAGFHLSRFDRHGGFFIRAGRDEHFGRHSRRHRHHH